MTCQLSTGINATAKLGALSETKMPDEGDEKRPTPLGLGQSLGVFTTEPEGSIPRPRQHNCTLTPPIDGVCVQLAYLNGSDRSPVLSETMSGAAAPEVEHPRFMGGARDGPELIHQRARLCPSGYPMALEK